MIFTYPYSLLQTGKGEQKKEDISVDSDSSDDSLSSDEIVVKPLSPPPEVKRKLTSLATSEADQPPKKKYKQLGFKIN